MKALKKLTKARATLVLSHPFWASLALQVPLVEDLTCRTGWTDGTRIAYNPDYIESISDSAVISFLGHEVAHPAFLHHLRENKRDHKKWNYACDYAINLILRDSGFEIPDTWLCDEKYRDMSAEEIYRLLPEIENKKDKSPEIGDESGEDKEEGNTPGDDGEDEDVDEEETDTGDGSDSGEEDNSPGEPGTEEPDPGDSDEEEESGSGDSSDESDTDDDGDSEPDTGKHQKHQKDQDGSLATDSTEGGDDEEETEGDGESEELDYDEDYGPGEVRPYPGKEGHEPSPSERRQEEIEWKTKISQAAEIARSQGDFPDSLERFVKELITPKVNWKAVLASYISEALESDYSWKQPNTRYASAGVYLPALLPLEGGDVLVIIDTSCSISEEDMVELSSECQGIISAYEIELDVLYVDTEVQGHQHFTATDIPLNLEPRGGGGTDFRPGFEWSESCGKLPLCCVYLTDGWCSSFPEKSPMYPVLWVIGGDFPCKKFEPPFGEVIRIG